jgi:DNA-3-methyladenine glycosylase I
MKNCVRCKWCTSDEIYITYHDNEWGVPIHDDQQLFEFLILEGAQAGLSWLTVLKKRENYRECFDNFNIEKVARYTPAKIQKLLLNPGIIRNRLKVNSAVVNAKAALAVQKEWGSLAKYIWHFVDGVTIQNRFKSAIPAKTDISDAMSKDLKKRGFKFIGSTICYAFMQAVGMVNDHATDCFRYRQLQTKTKSPKTKSRVCS